MNNDVAFANGAQTWILALDRADEIIIFNFRPS